ncbi:peroxidase-like protein 2, partial [Poecilia reticulata]|uniref:peroxidase-like protein 2 n=1 Tax=Poecilia reticulata TaxID=8081 RepID=UPI0007E9A116
MAASEVNLEDFSVYAHLTDEELLQIAVERSLSDKHPQADTDQRSAPRGPPPEPRNPEPTTDPPRPEHVQNCANPPTALTNFLYSPLNRESSPLLKAIMDGDAEALMDLVRQRPGSLTEPCDQDWVALHEAAYYGQLQCIRILLRGQGSAGSGGSEGSDGSGGCEGSDGSEGSDGPDGSDGSGGSEGSDGSGGSGGSEGSDGS